MPMHNNILPINNKRSKIAKIQFASSSLLLFVLCLVAIVLFSAPALTFVVSSNHCRVHTISTASCSSPCVSRNNYNSRIHQYSGSSTEISMTSKKAATASVRDGDGVDNIELPAIQFRLAAAEDIPCCFEIESASYPSDEAATMESLVNRQKHAGDYFLLCTTTKDEDESILGFVCATRCHEFTEESMSELHDPTGRLLAIHSVVVDESYRRKGVASQLLNQYVQNVLESESNDESVSPPMESIVLIAKQHLLGFYVRCGFTVNRPSPIVHGKELWYDLELQLPSPAAPGTILRTKPLPSESWFCKTETFKTSLNFFKDIKPHLEAHTEWVEELRAAGDTCIVSGYRVDSEGKPGGGGLMFLAATTYEEAYELVAKNDPLIVNGCVDWELNGWKSQVGGITVD
jgi:ribosomal protein S18 acetylase RimI-like enzyme/uncharacterized protein YciI